MADPTRLILDALTRRHAEPRNGESRAWVYAEEVRVATGFSRLLLDGQVGDAIRLGAEQRIDAFALHTWPSKKYRRVAYEIKVSRSDLKRELEQPYKCAAALALSNQFYLVVPSEMKVDDFDLPSEWGVMLVSKGKTLTTVKAPWRDTPLPPYSFMLSLARNLQAVNPESVTIRGD